MKRILNYIITLTIVISTATLSQAGKLDDLTKLRTDLSLSLDNLKASGLGHAHPKIKELQKALGTLDLEIENTKELHRDIIVLVEGTESKYLAGHARHGKTDTALTELLNTGWKIEKIIPAGTTQEVPKNQQEANLLKAAYVWLSYEG